jgi:hypothetical protein
MVSFPDNGKSNIMFLRWRLTVIQTSWKIAMMPCGLSMVMMISLPDVLPCSTIIYDSNEEDDDHEEVGYLNADKHNKPGATTWIGDT